MNPAASPAKPANGHPKPDPHSVPESARPLAVSNGPRHAEADLGIAARVRLLALAAARLLLLAATPLVACAQPVAWFDDGSSLTLSNGILSAVFARSNGNCTDLRLAGGANLLANGGRLYFDANGSVDGGTSVYVPFTPQTGRVVTNTPQRAEIAFTDTNLTGFNAELHYVMRA